MKKAILLLVLSIVVFVLNAQDVEIGGKLKVTTMETDNAQEKLVVKQNDGTLATRSIASLPPPNSDTTRTLTSDLALAKLICECTTVPPFLVQSALDGGYTVEDLYKGGVPVQDILNGGVSAWDLLNIGVEITELHGKYYEGGLIFYIDQSSGYGMVISENDLHPLHNYGTNWGCWGTEITGADSQLLGDGDQNTLDILTTCTDPDIAADLCANYSYKGYNDWFLPTVLEMEEFWYKLLVTEIITFPTADYWTSSEYDVDHAWAVNMTSSIMSYTYPDKYLDKLVRAVRKFY